MTGGNRSKKWREQNPERWKELNKAVYERKRLKVFQHKENLGCSKCGYNRYGGALEWHHLDPSTKEQEIPTTSYFSEKAVKEREKCILVCANCHREIHRR